MRPAPHVARKEGLVPPRPPAHFAVTLSEFAERWRVRVRRDEDGTAHVPGRNGAVYEHDSSRLAVLFLGGTSRLWGRRKRACVAAGMELHQDGDCEGTLLFDPKNDAQSELAIQTARIKRRRQLADEQRQKLVAAGAGYRFSPMPTGLTALSTA